jgi:hypothetical protein
MGYAEPNTLFAMCDIEMLSNHLKSIYRPESSVIPYRKQTKTGRV